MTATIQGRVNECREQVGKRIYQQTVYTMSIDTDNKQSIQNQAKITDKTL